MKRVCCECGVVYGVKCGRCGNEALEYLGDDEYRCGPCQRAFASGEGGETHGYCPEHGQTQKATASAAMQQSA